MMTARNLALTAGLAFALATRPAPAADVGPDAALDWPHWRGPRGDGIPVIQNIKKDWTGGLKKLWEVGDLCKGKNSACWSAPAIVGDKLVVPGRDNNKDVVVCLNANTGDLIWKKTYDAPPGRRQVQDGNGPRATASIDSDHVYTFGCMGHVACWNLTDGKPVWMKDVQRLGGQRPLWGHSSSPLVYKDTVIVQGGGKVLVIAFNRKTGDVAWKSMTGKAGYAAPMLATVEGKPQLIAFTAAGLAALNPDDGKQLWAFPFETPFDMNCTTPVLVGGDRLLVSSSNYARRGGGTALLRLTAKGAQRVWANRTLGAAHNDPVLVDGQLYAYSGYSMNPRELQCVELATGKLKWRTVAAGGPGNVVLVDGLLMCLSNRGKLTLVKPNPAAFEKVTQFQAIRGAPVWTVSVIARGKLYVRFCNQLICYQLEDE